MIITINLSEPNINITNDWNISWCCINDWNELLYEQESYFEYISRINSK